MSVRLNFGRKFHLLTLFFFQQISVFRYMSFPVIKKWWSKLGEATESLQNINVNFGSAGSRGASGRGPVLGGRWGEG